MVKSNGELTTGTKTLRILGMPTHGRYVARADDGSVWQVATRTTPHHGHAATEQAAEVAHAPLPPGMEIEGDTLMQFTPLARGGWRWVAHGFDRGYPKTTQLGVIAPDGTRIPTTRPLPQGHAGVQFHAIEGVTYALLDATKGSTERRALASPTGESFAELRPGVFVAPSGEVLLGGDGGRNATTATTFRRARSTRLSAHEGLDAKGRLVQLAPSTVDGARIEIAYDAYGAPLGQVRAQGDLMLIKAFSPAQWQVMADNRGVIAGAISPPLGGGFGSRPVAIKLATGEELRGTIPTWGADDHLVITDPATGQDTLLVKPAGASASDAWVRGNTAELFAHDGALWQVADGDLHDGGRAQIVFAQRNAHGATQIAAFVRQSTPTGWSFSPYRGDAQHLRQGKLWHIAVGGQGYRITAHPTSRAEIVASLTAAIARRLADPHAYRAADPLRRAMTTLTAAGEAIDAPALAAQIADAAPALASQIGAALLDELTQDLPASEAAFPFIVGVASERLSDNHDISRWGNHERAEHPAHDYHPARLGFFVRDGAAHRPATIHELEAFFTARVGHHRALVRWDDLDRPTDVQIVDDVSDLPWPNDLKAAVRAHIKRQGIDLKATSVVAAYDACGTVVVRPLAVALSGGDATPGHPTKDQYQWWFSRLPIRTLLQATGFAPDAREDNAFFDRRSGWVRMGRDGTGRYNDAGGERTLMHEALGHGLEQSHPLLLRMVALAAYLDANAGAPFMERDYPVGPNEQFTTDLEGYRDDSARFFQDRPHTAQLLMELLQAPSARPIDDAALRHMFGTPRP